MKAAHSQVSYSAYKRMGNKCTERPSTAIGLPRSKEQPSPKSACNLKGVMNIMEVASNEAYRNPGTETEVGCSKGQEKDVHLNMALF